MRMKRPWGHDITRQILVLSKPGHFLVVEQYGDLTDIWSIQWSDTDLYNMLNEKSFSGIAEWSDIEVHRVS